MIMHNYREIQKPKQSILKKCIIRGIAGLVLGAVLGKGVEKISYDSSVENIVGNAQTTSQSKQDYKKENKSDEFTQGLYFIIPGAVLGLGAGIAAGFAKENDGER